MINMGEIENINKFIYFGVILDPPYNLGYVECYISGNIHNNSVFGSEEVFFFGNEMWRKCRLQTLMVNI